MRKKISWGTEDGLVIPAVPGLQVVCINDEDKPNVIPQEMWVEKYCIYTIMDVAWLTKNKTAGLKFAEVELECCGEFEYYDMTRFIPLDLMDAIESVDNLLDDIDGIARMN